MKRDLEEMNLVEVAEKEWRRIRTTDSDYRTVYAKEKKSYEYF